MTESYCECKQDACGGKGRSLNMEAGRFNRFNRCAQDHLQNFRAGNALEPSRSSNLPLGMF